MILQSVVYHITVSILGNFTPVKVTINSPKPSRATLIANNFSYIIPYKQAFSIIQARLWFKRNQCIYCMVNFFFNLEYKLNLQSVHPIILLFSGMIQTCSSCVPRRKFFRYVAFCHQRF